MSMVDWQLPEGWRAVLHPGTGCYNEGFDRNRTYRFLRHGDDEPRTFRLADQSPFFNVAGLYYRGLPSALAEAGEGR